MADLELSFEDLMFGGEEKKGKEANQNQQQQQNATNASSSNLTTSGKEHHKEPQTPKDPREVTVESADHQQNVLLVSTVYGGKLNFPNIVKLFEDKCGVVKAFSHRENQHFCFIQLEDSNAYENSLHQMASFDLDGYKITVERCSKISPGRDPRTHDAASEFKSSTLVFKNLPFTLKQEKLEELLNAYPHKPMNVSYLYDGTGMFRGMAFVKFKDIETAKLGFQSMNGMDITGRKVRIEYKRKIQEVDLPEEDTKIQDMLSDFRTNSVLTELAFPCASSYQRKMVHQFADKLGLTHYSTDSETRNVIVKKKDPNELQLSTTPPQHMLSGTSPSRYQLNQQQQQQRKRGNSHTNDGKMGSSVEGRVSQTPPGIAISSSPHTPITTTKGFNLPSKLSTSYERRSHLQSGGVAIPQAASSNNHTSPQGSPSYGTSPTYRNSHVILNRNASDIPPLTPSRQPLGPDGKTNGFSKQYQQTRTHSST